VGGELSAISRQLSGKARGFGCWSWIDCATGEVNLLQLGRNKNASSTKQEQQVSRAARVLAS
jgi:hypothetical protein